MSAIILYYFDVYARAEPLRIILNHAKVAFEDVRLNGEGFAALKAEKNLEFGQIPALEIDGQLLTQSAAILRYLGKQHGYYPADPLESW